MNDLSSIPEPVETIQVAKVLISIAFGAYVSACATGCGIALGDKVVLGSTGFLAEHNRGRLGEPLDQHSKSDRAALNNLIARRY